MAKPYRLKQIAEERNEALESLIPRLLVEFGSPYLVAVHIGVYPNAIRHWLLNNGYKVVNGHWIKADSPEEHIPHMRLELTAEVSNE